MIATKPNKFADLIPKTEFRTSNKFDHLIPKKNKFDEWYAQKAKQFGLNPDPNDPRHHYDYRSAFSAGAEPDSEGHWPSIFKKPTHPNRYVDGIDTITGEKIKNKFDNLIPTETRPNLLTRTLKGLARKTVIEPIKAVETKSKVGELSSLLDSYGLVRQFKEERGRSPTGEEFDEILKSGKALNLKSTQDAYKWFDLPPAQSLSEKGVELVTGVTSFVTKLALTKKILGGQSLATDVMSFEMVNEADGGTPGVGALLGYSLGAFGKMPAPTLARKGFRMAGQSATLAGFTAAAGGTAEDIVVAAMLPPVMNTLRMFPAMLKGKRADVRLTNEIRSRYPFMRDVPKDSTVKWARAMRDAGKVKAGEMTAKTWGKIHGRNLNKFSEQVKTSFNSYDKLKLPGVAQKGFKEALMRTYPKISSDVADKAIEIYNKKGLAEAGKYVSAASIIGDKIIPEPTTQEQERFDKDIAEMDRDLAAIQRGETPSIRPIVTPEAPAKADSVEVTKKVPSEIEALSDKELKERYLTLEPFSDEFVPLVKEIRKRKLEITQEDVAMPSFEEAMRRKYETPSTAPIGVPQPLREPLLPEKAVEVPPEAKLTAQQKGMKTEALRTAEKEGIKVTPEGNLILYHGTRSAQKIRESGNFPMGTYFATDETLAKRFAEQAQQKGKAEVMRVEVPAHKIFTSGGEELYFSANEQISVVEAKPPAADPAEAIRRKKRKLNVQMLTMEKYVADMEEDKRTQGPIRVLRHKALIDRAKGEALGSGKNRYVYRREISGEYEIWNNPPEYGGTYHKVSPEGVVEKIKEPFLEDVYYDDYRERVYQQDIERFKKKEAPKKIQPPAVEPELTKQIEKAPELTKQPEIAPKVTPTEKKTIEDLRSAEGPPKKPPGDVTFAEPPRPEGPNILMLAEVEKRLYEKAMLSEKRKLRPGGRRLAKQFIGKTDLRKMTEEELSKFGQIISKLPEPTYNNKGERIPPSIPKTTAITKLGEFEVGYKEPSIWKLLHAPEYYAEKLGIKSIVEKAEAGKTRFSLEYQQLSNKVDKWVKQIEKMGKTTLREKTQAKIRNLPTKAVARFRELLDTNDEPPDSLNPQEKELFNNFRSLTRWLLKRENEIRESLDLEPIQYRKAYVRHVAEGTAKEILAGRYPFPQGRKFWAEEIIAKKIFNPMEMHRTLKEDLEEMFSRDLGFATKSMLWTALKEIHLSQPIRYLEQQLTARGKDTPVYKNLSPSEQRKWDRITTIPARTRKWAREYVRTTFRGQQSDWDQDIEATVKKTGLNGLLNKYLARYGRALSHKPVSNFFTKMGRAQIMGVLGGPLGGRPRQILRNKFQVMQSMALYPLYKETWRTYAPIRALRKTTPDLERLLDKSLFLKAYTGTEEWPVDIKSKIAKASLRAYQWSATSNARQAMETAYWGMLPLFNKPKFKYYGWADTKRTYKEKPEFLYPSEEKLMLKEMEFGAAATQHNYTPIGMPEIFRHKTLTPITRLQSWWMNHYFRFTEEALRRAFTGKPTYSKKGGPMLPWKYRLGWLRYALIAVPILNMMRYERSYFFGAAPTGTPPFAQFAQGMYNYVVGKGADNDKQWKRGKKQMIESGKTFIPGYMAYKDFEAIWSGRKDLSSLFFYKKR